MSELPIDPNSATEDTRRKIDEKAAVKRSEAWESLGWPTSKGHMSLGEQGYI